MRKTRVRLELLTDLDMLLMFEGGITGGGMTQAVHHYTSVNNKYSGGQYNPSQESSYLGYLDANSLYGWAMSQPLSTGRFRWVDIKPDEIRKLKKREDKGYLLEVIVSYPRELLLIILIIIMILITIFHSCVNEWKLTVSKSWFLTYKQEKLRHPHSSVGSSTHPRINSRVHLSSD